MKDTEALSLPIATGDTIGGKYRVERLLGRGGMGFVVSARHSELGHLVAIKLLLPKVASRPDVVERFLREARASVQLKGDHATRVVDVGVADATGLPFMVMEYLEGASLATLLRTTRLPIGHAVALVAQACEAIEEAHNLGIVHRDIKPDNLFATKKTDGTPLVKVLDFGISQLPQAHPDSTRLTGTTDIIGTPLYRPRSLRPAIPERLELILLKCLEKRPDRRFQRASELQEALAAFAYRPADDDADAAPITHASVPRLALAVASTELDHGAHMGAFPPQIHPVKKPPSPLVYLAGSIVFAVLGFFLVHVVRLVLHSLP